MQLTKETENTLERFLFADEFSEDGVSKNACNWWQKKMVMVHSLNLAFFMLNDLAHSFFVTYIFGLSFSYVMKGITLSLKCGSLMRPKKGN